MTTKNITATQVDLPVKTDKYPKYTVHYEGNNGETWRIGNLAVKLDQEVRKKLQAVAKQINGTGATKEMSVEVVKEGDYWNLISVGAPTAPNVATSATKKPSGGGYDSLGNQIGNTITNSVNSLGVGKTVEEYKTRALEFVLMGNEIREIVESGRLETYLAEPTVQNIVEDDFVENDLTEDLGF